VVLRHRRGIARVPRRAVAAELARIVYHVLTKQEAFNGRFQDRPLSRQKHAQWPRRASPSV